MSVNLETLKTPELIVKYNEAAATLGIQSVIRFSDHRAAVRRTGKLLAQVAAGDKTPSKTKTKKPKAKAKAKAKDTSSATPPKKKRRMRFVFPYDGDDRLRTIRQGPTLRAGCIKLLEKGATFDQVKELVVAFDKQRDKPVKSLERRAYEIVRIMHYYLGYGLDHDMETGIITLHTRAPQRT